MPEFISMIAMMGGMAPIMSSLIMGRDIRLRTFWRNQS